jgi:potassium channel subfamily K, other eukaryote
MIQTLTFFIYTGVVALMFSRIEETTYVDGIYYMVVTFLSIGLGDITPHTSAFKVLTFPFTIIGITFLALIVTSIVRISADRARRRKLQLKIELKQPALEKERKFGLQPGIKHSATLHEELHKLREDEWKRERRGQLRHIAVGIILFLLFWFIGALIFHLIEVLFFNLRLT